MTTGNLYGYGPVDGPMTEDLPLRPNTEKGRIRVRIWKEALEAHRAGRIRTAEVRSSDYLGARAVTPLTLLVLPKGGRRQSGPRPRQTWTRRTAGPTPVTSPAPCWPSPRTPAVGDGLARANRTAEVVS
jgi:hypothetical protein